MRIEDGELKIEQESDSTGDNTNKERDLQTHCIHYVVRVSNLFAQRGLSTKALFLVDTLLCQERYSWLSTSQFHDMCQFVHHLYLIHLEHCSEEKNKAGISSGFRTYHQ